MKRLISCLLLIFVLLSLVACAEPGENNCTFYYLRTAETVRYGEADALIAPTTREISDLSVGLEYLLQLYLDGPVDEHFVSPFPKGTSLLSCRWEDGTLVLELSDAFAALDNIALTMAGGCLAATCRELAGAERITVHSGEATFEFDLNHYTFMDDSTAP